LRPGEEVRTPLVVLQFYQGERVRAQNIWRRWMLAHNLPRTDNNLPQPMLTSCSGGFFPGLKCNETDELRFIDTLTRQGIKLDYWWMDAGWYPCDAWPQVGTWEVDATRFPRGLKAISDYVHAQQTGLILWFEPERVAPNTWLDETHPDWLLGQDGGQKLLNLGHAAARTWLIEHIDAMITREGIDLYRQDFNMDPLAYWRAADAPDRQGITEIRHVEGYLAYWDELRRRHPDLLIDSCASGGRRNDLETLRRAIPLLRSDYQSFAGDPRYALGNQCHTYGLSSWIPYYGQGVYYNNDDLVYAVRSHYCPAFGFCADVRKTGTDWAQFRRLVDDWRKLAPCLLGDYYPLTPYRLDDDVWIAWQFDRPESGEGVVQAFRRPESMYSAAHFKLQGLDPDASYALTNVDVPGTTVVTGRELADVGLRVAIEQQPGAVVILYKKAAP
jgi:alpha-galactosidase